MFKKLLIILLIFNFNVYSMNIFKAIKSFLNSYNKELVDAIRDNDIEKVKELIESSTNLNTKDEFG